MSEMTQTMPAGMPVRSDALRDLWRNLIIGLIAFLTVVDLFATQAILPSLAQAYDVTPAAMGLAVNASTLGMAVAGLAVAFFSRHINRRLGILIALCVLADPDRFAGNGARSHQLHDPAHRAGALHGVGLHADARLSRRGMQRHGRGRCLRGLYHRQCREQSDRPPDLGRRRRPSRTCRQFLFLRRAQPRGRRAGLFHDPLDHADGADERARMSPFGAWTTHLRNRPLRAAFGIGFCILFAFIGTFTYVNFVLVREPLSLAPMALGLVYFVFLPSVLTTPFAGQGGAALRHAADLLECAGTGGIGPAAVAVAESSGGDRSG